MALCRYMTYLPQARKQTRWGWVGRGRVDPLDEKEVPRCYESPSRNGLSSLGQGLKQTSSESMSMVDHDVTPGRYGHPSLVTPLLSNQEVWAAGVTYESS